MKKTLLFSYFLVSCFFCFAQQQASVSFDSKKQISYSKPISENVTKQDASTPNTRLDVNSESSWVGAQLFYNLDGSNINNAVGSAKIQLNTVRKWKNGKFNLNVIGNISKFSGAANADDTGKDLRAISQSAQGLLLGLEPLLKITNNEDAKFSVYGGLVYKVNSFQKVNGSDEDVTLSQGRFSLGAQFEGLAFEDGGGLLALSIEGGTTVFDQDKYKKVFNKEHSSIFFVETTLIVPLFSRFGLLLQHSITQYTGPVFAAGIVIKNK